METNQYLSMFIDESKDHLQALNENLLNLETAPEDISIVQSIFRSAHTLKGMSATMGFEDIASLTHEMENVLDLVRNEKLKMNSFIFDTLFKSLDSLEAMVNDIIEGGSGKADVTQIIRSLKSIVSGDYAKDAPAPKNTSGTQSSATSELELDEYQMSVLQQSLESQHNVFFLQVFVREDCVLKAARAYMVFEALERNGEVVKSSPTVTEIEQEKFDQSFSVYYITKLSTEELQSMVTSISEIDRAHVEQIDDQSLKQLQQNKLEAQQQTVAAAPASSETAGADKKPGESATGQQAKAAPVANRTIRVDIERLDVLMNLFSELLIDRVRLESLASEIERPELTETIEHMSRVSSDLQNIVLKLRMVPVDTVFNRFPRMIRDIARNLNKKVELVITGADTELDRTVIDEIGDPLVHLLRNAIDHGVESTEERIAAGKPDTGTIHLRAYHSGNHVFIEIEDNGKGINPEAILKSALKKGVITQEEASRMSEQEAIQLLFAPGFSTAEKISDISGRGVGLDVVKSKITSLGGEVTVDSKPGRGTKFSIQLPLTLSIITAMLIRLGEERYALPLSSIVETSAIQKDKVRNVHGISMIEFRQSMIPVVKLADVFECEVQENEQTYEYNIIVIRKGEKMVGLIVDEFIGQQEIVLKTLGKYLTNTFAVSGATILGDGQVALIIDPNALVK